MNEEINGFQKENSDGLKTELSQPDLDEKIIVINKRIKKYKVRRLQIILFAILVVLIVLLILSAPIIVGHIYGDYPFIITVIFFVLISLGLSAAFVTAIIFQNIITSLEASLEEFQARQRIANQLDGGNAFRISLGEHSTVNLTPSMAAALDLSSYSSSYFFKQLVDINLQNLGAYYIQVKAQTNKSFTASLMAGAAGFVLISIGLILGFTNTANSQILLYISSGSGVVTEFIAAIFFYLYNRTVRQMKGYHDSLLNVQNILLSLKLVEDIKEEEAKAKMIGQMLEYLVGKQVFTSPLANLEREK